MASGSLDTLSYIGKIRYPKGIAYRGLRRSQTFQVINKKFGTKFGIGKQIKVDYSPGGGTSPDFNEARAAQDATLGATFTLQPKKLYTLFSLDGVALKNLEGDGAVVNALTHQMERKGKEHGENIAQSLWGNAGGNCGIVSSFSGGALVFTDARGTKQVKAGQYLQFSNDDGTGSSPAGLRDSGASNKVSRVDFNTNTVYSDTDWDVAVPNITIGDYAFKKGFYQNSMNGFLGWHPLTALTTASTDSYLGVNRALHPTALSGHFQDQSTKTKLEAINNSVGIGIDLGLDCTHIAMNALDYNKLTNELQSGSEVDIGTGTKNANTGFKGVAHSGTAGQVIIYPETFLLPGYALQFNPMMYTLYVTQSMIGEFLTDDAGGKLRMSETDDVYGARIGNYLEFGCEDPGNAMLIKLA